MKEKLSITIDNLDDIENVLRSLELIFQKLVMYYAEKDLYHLKVLVMSCAVWFGIVCRKLGYDEEDLNEN